MKKQKKQGKRQEKEVRELGGYSAEFLDALAERAHDTAREWFDAHGVPVEVKDLVDRAMFLSVSAEVARYAMEEQDKKEIMEKFLVHIVPDTTRLVVECGGWFY